MRRLAIYIGKRLLFVAPQLFGIVLVGFLLLKLIPGDPAVMMAGSPIRAVNWIRWRPSAPRSATSCAIT